MKKRCYIKGFTLIEVMIALSVVAIGLMAILKTMNEEINAANLTRNKIIALSVLENKIAEIRLNTILPDFGEKQGQQLLFNQTWIWQINTTSTANRKIRRVEVSILTSKDNKDILLKQNIYLADLR